MTTNLAEELRQLYFDIQKVINPNISIEVGAFQAEFSLYMKKTFPSIYATAFEANIDNYNNNKEFVLSNNVNYLNYAITDFVGTVNFLVQQGYKDGSHMDKNPGNNSILSRSDTSIYYAEQSVPSVTLDHYFFDYLSINNVISLWIDAEGASEQVLNGSVNLLNYVHSVFIEVEHYQFWHNQWLASDVDSFLSKHDFVAVASDTEYQDQNNVIYLKSNLVKNNEINNLLQSWH